MCDRRHLSQQLDRIKAHWPNLPTTTVAFDGYYELLRGYEDGEVTSAVSLILREYDGAAHPKPATLMQFIRRVGARSGPTQDYAMADGVYCPICGTTELVEVGADAVDTSLWSKLKRAFWEALGLVNPTQPYLVLPARMHPRCLPHCKRRAAA